MKTRQRLWRAVTMAALMLALPAARWPAADDAQQGMPVPVPSQAMLVERILTFDRALESRNDSVLVVAVLYQREYSASRDAQAQLASYAAAARATAWGRPIVWRFIAVESVAKLRAALQANSADAVYLTPMRAIDLRQVADEATALRLVTYAGVPDYLQQGVAVAFGVRESRPRILINLPVAKRAGADFTSQLLQLAEVLRGEGGTP